MRIILVYTINMYISLLGRQPEISIAELEQVFGSESISWFSDISALVDSPTFEVDRLGGTQKAGRIVTRTKGDWRIISGEIIRHYSDLWSHYEGKITLGISVYGLRASPRDIQKVGLTIKQRLKNTSASLRLIPNIESSLNTATSHHNKLGLSPNKVELLIIGNKKGEAVVAESVGAQNITAIASRDQGRPKRDAFVGMLPPKLARIMVNLSSLDSLDIKHAETSAARASADASSTEARREAVDAGLNGEKNSLTILDPFCGTGVVLQEALLLDFDVYGSDLSEKMIDFTKANLDWLKNKYRFATGNVKLEVGDAMKHHWKQPIDAVVAEGYLGQPFSAPPSPSKLEEVRGNCNHIISEFLKNISGQLKPEIPVVLAVPAWRGRDGRFTHLPLVDSLGNLGFKRVEFKNIDSKDLLYYREDQVVAREILVLAKRQQR